MLRIAITGVGRGLHRLELNIDALERTKNPIMILKLKLKLDPIYDIMIMPNE